MNSKYLLLIGTALCSIFTVNAADQFWTNSAGGEFTNRFNWSPNNVPAEADNANFNIGFFPPVTWSGTRTNANTFFNSAGGGIQAIMWTNSWLLTNSFVVGQNANSTSTVLHASGELRVTNAAGTARLIIGQNGRGTYLLQGTNVSVVADQLFVTNNGAGFTNSTLLMSFGALTTLRGSTITQAGNFAIGTLSNATATWNVLGGTNRVSPGSGSLLLGSVVGAGGELKVVGASTVWTNSGDLLVGDDGDSCLLLVSNGAKAFNASATLGNSGFASSNQAWVTGASSVWSNRNELIVGFQGDLNRLVVSNGGKVFNSDGIIGDNGNADRNAAFIIGPGSVWSNRSSLRVGDAGSFNQLVVSNGGAVFNSAGTIGFVSATNAVLVTGAGSVWSNRNGLTVGHLGSFNQLAISNAGAVFSNGGTIGSFESANTNSVLVTGSGSVWTNSSTLTVGSSSSFNQMVISGGASVFNSLTLTVGSSGKFNQLVLSNAGTIFSFAATIGDNSDANSNAVLVTGAGSVWSNQSIMTVGNAGSFNQLLVSNAGTVSAAALFLGFSPSSTNNRAVVDGGTLRVTNASQTAELRIVRGTNQLSNSGLIEADFLRMTSTGGFFEFNGGTLNVRTSRVANAQTFFVGNGASAATLNLVGGDGHSFSNGLTIRANGSLIGDGSITGAVTVLSGATLSPGTSVGKIALSNSPSLAGTVVMEISKAEATLTNDQVQVTGALTYGGTLTVTKIGSEDLAAGDRFPLFNASSYGGAYSTIVLPSLATGLAWATNLLVDGSLQVVSTSPPSDRFWTNPAGGTYNISANWLDGLVAGVTDNANFTNNSNYKVTWTADAAAANAFFDAGSVTVTQAIGSFSWLLTNSYILGRNVGTLASVTHSNGVLRVTNSAGTALLEIRRGTNRFTAGALEADLFRLTNTLGIFEFNGGTLSVRTSTVANAQAFIVGNNFSAATLNLIGDGTHSFANGVIISSNASLIGNGSISGAVTVLNGGTVAPGTSVGKVALNNSPTLQGALVMEISKNGSALTNDQVQVNGLLTYSGTLTVTNIGPDATLALGNRFVLFDASSYASSFPSNNLPPLAAGLAWTNKLSLDGSIEVVMAAAPSRPQFSSINLSGANLIMSGTSGSANGTYYVLTSTNVALPLTNWTPVFTNQFDGGGNFVFTNAINPAVPLRFYALQVHLDAATTVFFRYGDGSTNGSIWRYRTELTSATIGSIPASWKDEGFADATWAQGPSQIGYGDGDENTPVPRTDYDSGTAGTQSGPSYLFRATFSIADVNAVTSVTGEVKYDDGAVVYVNGTEILRTTNLDPAATLTNYADFNGAAATENATTALNVPLNLLHNGVNTIAVEVHQHDNTSSDVTFDLKLQAN